MRGNRLELGVKDAFTNVNPTNDITFKVTVKQIERLEISGSGKAEAKKLNPARLTVEISGSGAVAVQGTAEDLDLDISGSGAYDGELLRSKRANVDISGSGGAVLAASEALTANVSGSGAVEYLGDPKVTQTVSGSGSVRKR